MTKTEDCIGEAVPANHPPVPPNRWAVLVSLAQTGEHLRGADTKGKVMQDFEGKTAVITGGASGIGLALAEKCAELRMNVVIADIQEDARNAAVESLEQRQTNAIGVEVNTMVKESIDNLLDEATSAFGNVHLLFNNAGVASMRQAPVPVWETPTSDWQWVMGVNFDGVLYGLQTFVPHMLEHGEPGHVVNTASLAALMPVGGTYGVSKQAVLGLTESLQRDLQASGARISSSVLCPGFVNTNIYDAERNRPEDLTAGNSMSDEMFQQMETFQKTTLAAGKQPSEIAEIVFDSIREDRFYILPHPAWDDLLVARMQQVIDRGPVATLDPAAMQQKRESGETL
jgi:NAD(P)-dependent dehydrogenase (short-subunit alcohol dehydrogenase family)